MGVRILFLPIFICLFEACHFDKTSVKPISLIRFDQELESFLQSSDTVAEKAFYDKYHLFFPIYVSKILHLPEKDIEDKDLLRTDLSPSNIQTLYRAVDSLFNDTQPIETELAQAFNRYRNLLPDDTLPTCLYTHISGWQQQIVNMDTILSISLDHYLGSDYEPYRTYFNLYQLPGKNPENIVPDVLRVILYTRHPLSNHTEPTLLKEMIYEGKVIYCLQQILTNAPVERLLGYTPEQFQWCRKNEQNIWNAILQQKDLYSTQRILIEKYLAPAPFTAPLTQQSPGQVGRYVGWRIISEYMRHAEKNLSRLWEENNELNVLKTSKYKG